MRVRVYWQYQTASLALPQQITSLLARSCQDTLPGDAIQLLDTSTGTSQMPSPARHVAEKALSQGCNPPTVDPQG